MKQTQPSTRLNPKIIIAVAIMILAVISLSVQFVFQQKQQAQPEVFVVGSDTEPVFFLSTTPTTSSLAVNASTVVTMRLSSGAGKVQTLAAKISWDPGKYTFDQAYGLKQAGHGFSPVQSINLSDGIASVAYIPMIQGGDIALAGGDLDLFTIKLVAKVSNPSVPTATGTFDGFIASASCGNSVCESGETTTNCAVDCAQSSTFSVSTNPLATGLAANASTIATISIQTSGGKAQTMAAKITWNPAQYTFDQAYGLKQAGHGFSPVQSINLSDGIASVAYIPMVQGGDITVPSGRTELFSIKLTSKVANPSMPTGTGQIELTDTSTCKKPGEMCGSSISGAPLGECCSGKCINKGDGGICSSISTCGNGTCEVGETATNCATDCGDNSGTCQANSKRCTDTTHYQVCNSSGSAWGNTQSCASGQGCVGGSCIDSVPGCSTNIYISRGEYEFREMVVGLAPLTAYLYLGGGVDGTGGIQGYQVDYEGDGIWDTPYFDPYPKGYITHTYTQVGNYSPKYRISSTTGAVSAACGYVNSIEVIPSISPVREIQLKTKLKGVSRPGVSIMAVVDIMKANDKGTPLATVTLPFQSGANGVFSTGTVSQGQFIPGPIQFDLGGYTGEIDIRIKGPKHVRARFDGYQIQPLIDLSQWQLVPGDLPWNNGKQDGGADVEDWKHAMAHVTKLGEEKAEDLAIADINYDGVVDESDVSAVRLAATYQGDAN
jgi:hypothetical protein